MGFYSVQGVIGPICQTLNLEDQLGHCPYSSLIPPTFDWTNQGENPWLYYGPRAPIHVGLRIMQAWPPQQGDKLRVFKLKRQSIFGESYYLPPHNTTNKVLKALKTERLWLGG